MASLPLLLTTAAAVGDFLGIDVLNPSSSDWKILDNNSNAVIITPDTVPRFEFSNDVRVSDFPVQNGAFASYNSVQMPFEINMTLVCGGLNILTPSALSNQLGLNLGNQFMKKSDFLTTLESMLSSINLFQIVTPDEIYKNAKLEHFDYRRETNRGATILYADCRFREIRQVGTANNSVNGLPFVNTNVPSASNPVNNGIVKTHPLDKVSVTAVEAGVTLE